jgi:hypothetical protein
MVLTLHFATNFVREHYPALTLAEHGSFKVNEYVGLHPDIFVAPSGDAFINNNPGVSILAAVPLFVFRPALDWAEAYGKRKVAESDGNISAVYKDHRPNRRKFYQQVRERGLDLKFGLVSFLTVAFLMAPITAYAGVVMFDVLHHLEMGMGKALFFSFLFVLGTPIFFRNGYLNHNLVLGHLVFFAFVLLWKKPSLHPPAAYWTVTLAGFLGGFAVLCDYSGMIALAFLFSYTIIKSAATIAPDHSGKESSLRSISQNIAWFSLGAALPLAFLLFYQWAAFGSPFRAAQAAMPETIYSVHGYHGITWPQPDLLWANLFDLRFGLFAFCPLLLLALPGMWVTPRKWFSRAEMFLIIGFFLGFVMFTSMNQFARLQWNTGMRYLVPVIPFLFLYAVAAMSQLPRLLVCWVAILSFAQSWSLSMVRESVAESLSRVFLEGFQLPWLTVLTKMAPQYAPFLAGRASPLPLFLLCGAIIYGVWRIQSPGQLLSASFAKGDAEAPTTDPGWQLEAQGIAADKSSAVGVEGAVRLGTRVKPVNRR